jgi:hypothetical protein
MFRSTGKPQHEMGAWGRGRLPVDQKLDKFQLQNHPKKKSPGAFFMTWSFHHPDFLSALDTAVNRWAHT